LPHEAKQTIPIVLANVQLIEWFRIWIGYRSP